MVATRTGTGCLQGNRRSARRRHLGQNEGEGVGTRFSFTVPVVEETACRSYSVEVDPQRKTGYAETILVVDEDPEALGSVRRVLSGAGYRPIVTADPDEAVTLVVKNLPHLVLLDMMLPSSDWLDLTRDIMSITDVPLILFSAYSRDQTVALASNPGPPTTSSSPFHRSNWLQG